MKKISPCLWFDSQAEEAAAFYTRIFKNSKRGKTVPYSRAAAAASGRQEGSTMIAEFQLEDLSFIALNGGPQFKFSPALSFFVGCDDVKEIEFLWSELSSAGTVRMALDKYPWSERYGWVADRFGVNWQLVLGPRPAKISPCFVFVDKLFGRAQEALDFYLSVFPNAKCEFMARDPATNSILHSTFTVNGQGFVLSEGQGSHDFQFTHATSLTVPCESQKEIDHFWNRLSAGGKEEPCGWLQDRFGVSWQIVPAKMEELMKDPNQTEKVMGALMQMKKIDLKELEAAASS